MNNKGKVLIAAPIHDVLRNGLLNAGYELEIEEKINQEKGLQLIKGCVGVVTSNRLNLDKKMIDAAPDLQFIARMGSGMEVIDTDYANSKGIKCFGSPEGNCNAVAEHALGMLLSLTKNIDKSYNEIKEGKWLRDENRGMELEGKTIGIIGFGHTGSAFAKLLRGFDSKILVFDKYKTIDPSPYYTVCSEMIQIQELADIISLHVPFGEDTFHLINSAFVNNCKKPIVLLNTSRGSVVDTSVLLPSLKSEKISAIALDVWEEEPLQKMSELSRKRYAQLLDLPQVLLTPHIAGYSNESLYKMSAILLERIIQ